MGRSYFDLGGGEEWGRSYFDQVFGKGFTVWFDKDTQTCTTNVGKISTQPHANAVSDSNSIRFWNRVSMTVMHE